VAVAAALVVGLALPAVNPPVIPRDALARLEGRDLYVYDYVPGLFTLAAGRPVHRVDAGDELRRALSGGGVVIASASSARKLPADVLERVVPVTRWEHIRGYLPEATVLRSWRERDPGLLFEPMLALELPAATRPQAPGLGLQAP
ncbi:MAG TPA: hypothetical protein VFP65_13720, partial [Anaeromyxobacteraceae bacterium]|nr:hypothetical protein [Anaeromyxobacteraceae bacterium]